MTNYSYTEEQLIFAVANSRSFHEVHKKLELKGTNYRSLRRYISSLALDTSHFCVNGLPLSEILIKNSNYTKTGHLKNRLIKAELKEPICEDCGIKDWRGKPISLHLHHVNGDHRDNRLLNLQILCPNCHSQTDNFGVKNAGKGRPRK